jgi:hypothetical protein
MSSQFERSGISFRYPENWQLDSEECEGGWSISLQSPGTAFLTLTLDEGMPPVEDVADAALEALRDVYPDLVAEDRVEKLAGQAAVGHDIDFSVSRINHDLTNTCWTRSFYSDNGTVLVLCQANDLEMAEYGPVLLAVCASLRIEE